MRRVIRDFGIGLEETLTRNDYKPCWEEQTEKEVIAKLDEELVELLAALAMAARCDTRSTRNHVLHEALDVAAVIMMLWDKYRITPSRKRGTISGE